MRAWVKDMLDRVIQLYLGDDDLEFAWAGDDVTDPLQQAQTLQILIGSGVKTVDEARADLGLTPLGKGGEEEKPAGFGKFNPYHDERGRFTTADGAQETAIASPTHPSHGEQLSFAGTLMDRRYDKDLDITHCTYSWYPNTFTIEHHGYYQCEPTFRAERIRWLKWRMSRSPQKRWSPSSGIVARLFP